MDNAAAKYFDRSRDFTRYAEADIVGAARWLLGVMHNANAWSETMVQIEQLFLAPLTKEREEEVKKQLMPLRHPILQMGGILTTRRGELSSATLAQLDWHLPKALLAPLVQGKIRVERASEDHAAIMRETTTPVGTRPIEKIITLEAAGKKWPLVCADDPLECLGADLSVFEGAYDVAVRAWPDAEDQLFVLEAGPLMRLPGLSANDFAQGRLYDNGDLVGPIVLRVNKHQQKTLPAAIHEELRPFVGTAVILYGKRLVDSESGQVSLVGFHPHYWVLCRLTDPKDDAYQLAQAPLPSLQKEGCLCIGGTPPWNWEGPNVRTHLLAPSSAIGLTRTTERRLVFGRALNALPAWVDNPIPEIKRVFQVLSVTERDTDTEAQWGTRLGPMAPIFRDLAAISQLTFATSFIAVP